jgi:hypothetical protein|tara:strand:- start:408 stop:572 length:165 start_codon:yes stop_codon:yes gene_type:complete
MLTTIVIATASLVAALIITGLGWFVIAGKMNRFLEWSFQRNANKQFNKSQKNNK